MHLPLPLVTLMHGEPPASQEERAASLGECCAVCLEPVVQRNCRCTVVGSMVGALSGWHGHAPSCASVLRACSTYCTLGRFGLLDGCSHAFCLPCIRAWRETHAARPEVARSCPVCRTPSHFVIPSSFLVAGERKPSLIRGVRIPACPPPHPPVPTHPARRYRCSSTCVVSAQPSGLASQRTLRVVAALASERMLISCTAGYQRKLRAIPCKHFAFGASSCPFVWSTVSNR